MKTIKNSPLIVLVMLAVLVGRSKGGELMGSLSYADVHERAAKAIAVPQSGAHELRIITPTLLEVYIVSERDGFANRPTFVIGSMMKATSFRERYPRHPILR